ncbi:TIGR02757 family protein [Odoribacter sp. OttesenSCG-928-L07]|nr:TIGR02757 family protein [Odoribacter sp. OttesenSCG-928-L07]
MTSETASLLNKYYDYFENKSFIENDPISIPHKFTKKEDIEIAGFLSATIAWGNRKAIISSCNNLMERMDNAPYDFIINASKNDISSINGFYYRTFQNDDVFYFIHSLHNIYKNHKGLEYVFLEGYNSSKTERIKHSISYFHNIFFEKQYPQRVTKHVANPAKGSAAKRINMFLRWMVRSNNKGVDFGLWKDISTSELIIPLDVHVGNTARKLNLIDSKSNNWNTAENLTNQLRKLDSNDPVKYDFALFGISNSKISL